MRLCKNELKLYTPLVQIRKKKKQKTKKTGNKLEISEYGNKLRKAFSYQFLNLLLFF